MGHLHEAICPDTSPSPALHGNRGHFMPHLDCFLGDPLPREVRHDLVVLMEQELAPFCIPEQHPQVPAQWQTLGVTVPDLERPSKRGMQNVDAQYL